MDEQRKVARFVASNDLDAPPTIRLLDLVSEVGELAKDLVESTAYGTDPDAIHVADDEIGDVLFALLALADTVDIDADDALDRAIDKYDRRLDERGSPGSNP